MIQLQIKLPNERSSAKLKSVAAREKVKGYSKKKVLFLLFILRALHPLVAVWSTACSINGVHQNAVNSYTHHRHQISFYLRICLLLLPAKLSHLQWIVVNELNLLISLLRIMEI